MTVAEEEKQEEAPPQPAENGENKDVESPAAENIDAAAVEVTPSGVKEENDEDPKEDDGEEEEEGGKKKIIMKVSADAPWSERMWEVFSTFWPLGLVAFGGPQVRFERRYFLRV